MDPVETFQCGDKTVKIYPEESPSNPRREWDNLGVMAAFHRRYDLGDKDHGIRTEDFGGWDEMEAHLRKELGAVIVLPLFLYDHSGLRIATSSWNDPWDSGQVGFTYVTADALKKEYGTQKITPGIIKKAKKVLEQEVATYDDYLSGNVYRYEVEDAEGNVVDSLGDIYDFKYAVEEARAAAGCKKKA